jgi:GNAT superfamily N-acetyltransferase
MSLADIHEVVCIHLASFQGFFLSFLGTRFLRELYAGILDDPTGIAYVFESQVHLMGFVAGTSEPEGFYRRLLSQRWWRFAVASMGPALKNPLIITRLLRALRKPQEAANQPDTGTLMSMAVLPQEQGAGIGQVLVMAFLQEAARRGLRHVDLTTDRFNNDSVNSFYQKRGFRFSQSYVTPEGREMNTYVIDLYHLKPALPDHLKL